jgi:hypothetical protein
MPQQRLVDDVLLLPLQLAVCEQPDGSGLDVLHLLNESVVGQLYAWPLTVQQPPLEPPPPPPPPPFPPFEDVVLVLEQPTTMTRPEATSASA